MRRTYRKSRKESRNRKVAIVDRAEALLGRVVVELPVSLAEVVEGVSKEIERLAGEAGLRLMDAVIKAEVDSLAGRQGRHDPDRQVYRWGSQGSYAVLAGKKIPLRRPRVRDRQGREVALESYRRFQSPPRRQRSIMKKLVHGISTRKYERAIEDFTDGYGITKSAVSREAVRAGIVAMVRAANKDASGEQ